MTLDALPTHNELKGHAKAIKAKHMRQLFESDAARFNKYSIQGPQIFLDYSKNLITEESLSLLFHAAHDASLKQKTKALFSGELLQGEALNNTENRAALHTALRRPKDSTLPDIILDGVNISKNIRACQDKMAAFVAKIHAKQLLGFTGKPIQTLVSIGIGGSFLGPKMVTEALKPFAIDGFKCHYVANIDSTDLTQTLNNIDPETTLFLLQSKSFSTLETLENAYEVKRYLKLNGLPDEAIAKHFIAVTSNKTAAYKFGITDEHIFPMWDWVGGRYSLWSAIGLPIAFQLGMDNFEALLEGAFEMDQHFQHQDFEENMPVIMALLGIWYHSYFGADSHAILPYDQYLQFFPDHLQQLDMESNGKSVDRSGHALNYNSGPIIWGGIGCNGQHAYHQLLHQGTQLTPADFIVSLSSHNPIGTHHKHLFANCLSQSQALMKGKTYEEALQESLQSGMPEENAKKLAPHKVVKGNQPSNTLILDELNPKSLGTLIALYEHKVFVQSVIWDINPFDQWGVELGKTLSNSLFDQLESGKNDKNIDSSTAGLLAKYPQA